MSTNSKITPLCWETIINEALKRRKAERITQKEHAALANVSIPTMAAFERGSLTLTLSKAFDILNVVGLINESSGETAQDTFVHESFAKYEQLAKNSSVAFTNGWFRFDYYLEGNLKQIGDKNFEKSLFGCLKRLEGLGWPPFWFSKIIEEKFIKKIDNAFERCLLPHDYWRASSSGHMFLIGGYQEDVQETFPAKTIFDVALPIWRMGEVLLHAECLAASLKENPATPINIHFRALYFGLNSRVLRSWAMPDLSLLIEEKVAQNNEAFLETIIPAYDVSAKLVEHLYPLTASLYKNFGIAQFPRQLVEIVTSRLLDKLENKPKFY
jgi:transcriptional regulator with XRE-family HTH domain